eukprot:CAMPEP_0171083754 /NCGR_PEP_ID=MMETSP0766_2-20121228/17907_1 /TAXON_ID=439317 /ORGANISM="Gambierdiscus australes, Strain CAWD 149" /LENGTH=145 /DNA_ID=CAMNT_0011541203 /DNA_START=139 /DNA_END=572 /DNA_ORIENTATION=-
MAPAPVMGAPWTHGSVRLGAFTTSFRPSCVHTGHCAGFHWLRGGAAHGSHKQARAARAPHSVEGGQCQHQALGSVLAGFGWDLLETPPSSTELALFVENVRVISLDVLSSSADVGTRRHLRTRPDIGCPGLAAFTSMMFALGRCS